MSHVLLPNLILDEGKAHCFKFPWEGKAVPAFVIRYKDQYYAYINRCAHVPVPLDYDDGDFLDQRIGMITCKLHGAFYDPTSGQCVAGPCAGDKLQALALSWQGNDAIIEAP